MIRRKASKKQKSKKSAKKSSGVRRTKKVGSKKRTRRNPGNKRDVSLVPYLKLRQGRLEGVVASKSDEDRMYCTYLGDDGNYYCSTNSNRPCGGLKGSGPCVHMGELITEAIKEYGPFKVVKYLQLPLKDSEIDQITVENATDLLPLFKGGLTKIHAGEIFSHFNTYLEPLNLPATTEYIPEMGFWPRRTSREIDRLLTFKDED